MGPQVSLAALFRPTTNPRPSPSNFDSTKSSSGFQDYLDSLKSPPSATDSDYSSTAPNDRPSDRDTNTADSAQTTDAQDAKPVVSTNSRKPVIAPKEKKTAQKEDVKADAEPTSSPDNAAAAQINIATNNPQSANGVPGETANVTVTDPPVVFTAPKIDNPQLGHFQSVGIASPPRSGAQTQQASLPISADITTNISQIASPSAPIGPVIDQNTISPEIIAKQETAKQVDTASVKMNETGDQLQEVATKSTAESVKDSNAQTITVREGAAAAISHKAAPDARPVRANSPHHLQTPASSDEKTKDAILAPTKTGDANDSSRQSNGNPASGTPTANSDTASPGLRISGDQARLAELAELKLLSVKTADGDSAAATVGRFLVANGAASSDAGAQSALQAPNFSVATRATMHTTTNNSQPATTISSLLTAPTDVSSAVNVAARLITASATANGHQQATLQLDPPELGQLRIDIRMSEHGMAMRIDADNASAGRLIESRLPELRDALAVHGIRVDNASVVVRTPETSDGNHQFNQDRGGNHEAGAQQQQFSSFDDGRGNHTHQERSSWSGDIAAASAEADQSPESFARANMSRTGINDRYVNLVA